MLFFPEAGFMYPRLASNSLCGLELQILSPSTTMPSLQKAEDTQDVKHSGQVF